MQHRRMFAGLALVAAADAVVIALVASESEGEAVLAVTLSLLGLTAVAGFLIARWWVVALAVPLFVALTVMWDRDGELSFVGWVVLGAGMAAGIQAVALAVGAASRWALSRKR